MTAATTSARSSAGTSRGAAELALHLSIRRQVFVSEQRIFGRDDRDDRDDDAATVHVVGYVNGVAAGTVRLYPLRREPDGPTLWRGDRLAVLPEYRRHHVGGPLVRYAVRTAGGLGGGRMIAARSAGQRRLLPVPRLEPGSARPGPYEGIPHQRMSIGLGRPQ